MVILLSRVLRGTPRSPFCVAVTDILADYRRVALIEFSHASIRFLLFR